MISMKASEIANMAGGRIISGNVSVEIGEVFIDSRDVTPGSGFVALTGETTDGHRFIQGAYEKGASLIMISDLGMAKEFGKDALDDENCAIILVEDTLLALQTLSEAYLEQMGMRCIAVTGSVGKTTTRDMLYAAVNTTFKSGTNKKNYNSETGLPLTLLSFEPNMDVGVLEMGMDALGQIERLAEIAKPEAAIITNIGISHISRLGSRENIMKAKMEITRGFLSENTLIINNDDDMLSELKDKDLPYRLIRVGMDPSKEPDYLVKDVKDLGINGTEFKLATNDWEEEIKLPIPGEHNALDAGLAVAGAILMGVDRKKAISGIMSMKTTGSRMKVSYTSMGDGEEGITIIDDAYNAAPASMKSALKMLSNTEGNRRIAILGGINELGDLSETEHRNIGKYSAGCQLDMLITIGEMAEWIEEGAKEEASTNKPLFKHFDTKEELYPLIKTMIKPGDIILIKASRSFELDKLAGRIPELLTCDK